MKQLRIFLMVVLCIALTAAVGNAKKTSKTFDPDKVEYYKPFRSQMPEVDVDLNAIPRAAAQGTTFLGVYDFDSGASCVADGWVGVDLYQQLGNYWHVDDFVGLGGGDYGNLVTLQGAQSMWLGVRPDPNDPIVCGYATAPGYGGNWDQSLVSDCLTVTGDVTFTLMAAWDIEANYDWTELEYSPCDDNWVTITTAANAEYGGKYRAFEAGQADTAFVASASHSGSIRFRFHFMSDIASDDQDGYFNTDGAIILDSLRVRDDTGVVSYEDFESANVGDNGAGDWGSVLSPPYGNYTGLLPGLSLVQEDPCQIDLDCMWGFFAGSTYNYGCGGFASQAAVPYGNARDQFINNQIWSPVIPWTGTGSTAEFTYNVYRDLRLDALVFFLFAYRDWYGTCPGGWEFDFKVGYGDDKDWFPNITSFSEFVDPAATHIQLAIAVWDLCGAWCGIVGSGACHSHSPLIDDVEIYRVATSGPIWQVDGFDLFQDNFATDGTVTGTVRVDMANSILPRPSLGILPGDSTVVSANDPDYGVAGDSYTSFGPACYLITRVDPPQPSKAGNALVADFFRWPVVDSLVDASGDKWYYIRCDTVFNNTGRDDPVQYQYCADVNDNLLTPGDTLWFFFGAQSADAGGSWSYYFHEPRVTENVGVGAIVTTTDINVAINNAEEMTCLPAAGLSPGNDILYVDDFSNRGSQPFFDTAFDLLGIKDRVDRYDVRDSDSGVGNGLGGRVVNTFQQIIPYYKKIIWYSGDLTDGLIGDGLEANDRSDDFGVLWTFLDQSPSGPGLWISGDYNATEWFALTTTTAVQMRTAYMNFGVLTQDHKTIGLPISPLVIGSTGGAFDNPTGPDTLTSYGGCNKINKFDVLQQTGASVVQSTYDGNPLWPSSLSQTTPNSAASTATVLLEGFGFHYIRDDAARGVPDRVIHMQHAIEFLGNVVDDPTGVDPMGYTYSLSQNYPNPFNPTTSISYTVKNHTNVSLKVYNVAGQLTRTLVNDMKTPGQVHTATWDGRNDAGQSVSSGVYFYKLVAGDFVQTKKMVLLK
jgi:hypothetical protein